MPKFDDILIVTDLDGTFFGKSGAPVPRNLEAVERFKAQGGHFTLATGRTNLNLKHKWSDAEDLVNAPIIACNGAMLYDMKNDVMVAQRLMNREHVMDVIGLMVSEYPDLGSRISVADGFLTSPEIYRRSEKIQRDLEKSSPARAIVIPEDEWLDIESWYKLVVRGSASRIDEFRVHTESLWPDRFETSKSGAAYLEYQSPNTNKATMLRQLKDYVEKKVGRSIRVYACGDYENDLAMLNAADVGVCPTNAIDSVKEAADLCLCHHTEGLIAALIELLDTERT